MPNLRNRRKFYFLFTSAALTITAIIFYYLSLGPDYTITFSRDIPSTLNGATIDRSVQTLQNWPNWFYSLAQARLTNPAQIEMPNTEQFIRTGSWVRLSIDPKKGKWKKFDLVIEILEYVPGERVRMRVLEDSKARLTGLFDSLEWKVEWKPQGAGVLLHGEAVGHTAHWRSRLFGRIAQRILMNQVFYPDLFKLAELSQPVFRPGSTSGVSER